MKLLIAIVNNEDASLVISELNKAGFMVTNLPPPADFSVRVTSPCSRVWRTKRSVTRLP